MSTPNFKLQVPPKMSTPNLPIELITDILLRLRVKTLLRFKTVSKSWYLIINSPNFIKLHLSQTLTSGDHPNLLISHDSLSCAVIDDGLRTIHFSELDHPLKHLPVQFHGCCNGVVLISDYFNKSVFLYNPSNKTHRLIPPFSPSAQTNPVQVNILDLDNANLVLFGLGYDSVLDDYKALRVIETRKNNAVVYREAAVYSLKSDSWKYVVDEQLHKFQPCNGGLFNECLHFIVATDSSPHLDLVIKCFNLGTEKFSIFNIPAKIDDGRSSTTVGELGGCFFLVLDYHFSPTAKSVIWVMKEYGREDSWSKMYTFSGANINGYLSNIWPVLYSKDRRKLLIDVDGYWFGWYDIGRNKCKRIKAYGTPPRPDPFETWTIVDNLVSLCRLKGKSNGGTAIKKHKGKSKGRTAIKRNDFLSSGFKLRL